MVLPRGLFKPDQRVEDKFLEVSREYLMNWRREWGSDTTLAEYVQAATILFFLFVCLSMLSGEFIFEF